MEVSFTSSISSTFHTSFSFVTHLAGWCSDLPLFLRAFNSSFFSVFRKVLDGCTKTGTKRMQRWYYFCEIITKRSLTRRIFGWKLWERIIMPSDFSGFGQDLQWEQKMDRLRIIRDWAYSGTKPRGWKANWWESLILSVHCSSCFSVFLFG